MERITAAERQRAEAELTAALGTLRTEFEAKLEEKVAAARKDGEQSGINRAIGIALEAKALQQNSFLAPATPRPSMYAFDTPTLFAQHHSTRTRPKSRIDLETLRRIAGTYDPLRSCIEHLKREVEAVPGKIVSRDPEDKSDSTKRRVDEMNQWFNAKNVGLGGVGRNRRHFEAEILEDVLTLGAYAAYVSPTLGGMPYEVTAIDSITIRPKVNAYGWQDPDDAFQQQILGVVVRESISMKEMIYDGLHPVSFTPYFVSPVEWLIGVTMSALKADEWNRTWLTDGTTADQILSLPADYTPDDVANFQALWELMSQGGNPGERHKTKFLPSGSSGIIAQSRKDADFQEFELSLIRRTCAIYGVQPASIGYVGEQYKVSQEGSMEATSQFGVGRLLQMRKDLYDDLLERHGHPDLEWRNVTEGEESPGDRADRLAKSTWMTDNEKRQECGLEAIDGGDDLPAQREADQAEANRESKKNDAAKSFSTNEQKRFLSLMRSEDMKRWEAKALRLGGSCGFESDFIDDETRAAIADALTRAETAEAIRGVFALYRGN